MNRIAKPLTAFGLIWLSPVISFTATVLVPADSATIQAGINGAEDYGDTVLVADGIYTGDGNWDIDFAGKHLVLKSENGPEFTIIDCKGDTLSHGGFDFHMSEDSHSVLDGFTIQNAVPSMPGGGGGGVCCDGASPIIRNCIFFNNGGYIGGGLGCFQGASPIVEGCTFQNNWAFYGGGVGIHCCNTAPVLVNCVFIENGGGFGGGAVSCYHSSVECINSTLSRNSSMQSAGGIEVTAASVVMECCVIAFSIEGEAVYCGDSSDIMLNCCDIYGNAGGDYTGAIAGRYGTDGNFSANPRFCDTATGDYHLASNSPCLAENNSCGVLIGALDMGCEAIYVCGDANGDEAVNLLDITFLINYLYQGGLPPDPIEAGDADGNEAINLLDITYLINYLYRGGPEPVCPSG